MAQALEGHLLLLKEALTKDYHADPKLLEYCFVKTCSSAQLYSNRVQKKKRNSTSFCTQLQLHLAIRTTPNGAPTGTAKGPATLGEGRS